MLCGRFQVNYTRLVCTDNVKLNLPKVDMNGINQLHISPYSNIYFNESLVLRVSRCYVSSCVH